MEKLDGMDVWLERLHLVGLL